MRVKEGVLGVKIYGSRAPHIKETGDNGMANFRKERQTSVVHHPWGQRDGAEIRHLDPGGIWD